jgi:hypothetical protein
MCSVGSCNASTLFIPNQMSYFILLTSITPRVFVTGVELQLLLVRGKRAQSIQLKTFIFLLFIYYIRTLYIHIMGFLLAMRFGRNRRSSGNTYVKVYKEEF